MRGCAPKKVLVGAAAGGLTIEWPALMRFKRSFTESVRYQRVTLSNDASIATYHSVARFTDSTSVDAPGETLNARRVVLATGARPGYIAFEFAQLTARAGANRLVEIGDSAGVDVRLNVSVAAIEARGDGVRVSAAIDGEPFAIDCAISVRAATRVPDLDQLGSARQA